MCGSGNPTLPTILVPTLFFFRPVKKYIKKSKKIAVLLAIRFSSTGIVASVITGRSYNRTSATSVFNLQFFFYISALKVMDSVSVLLNIFKPKCERAAELWTFKILNGSLSFEKLESRFFMSSSNRKKKINKKNRNKIPTYPT